MEINTEEIRQTEELVDEKSPIDSVSTKKSNNKNLLIGGIIIAVIIVAGIITTILLLRKANSRVSSIITSGRNSSTSGTLEGINTLPIDGKNYKLKNSSGKYIFWNGTNFVLHDTNSSTFTFSDGGLTSTNPKERFYFIKLAGAFVNATGANSLSNTGTGNDLSRWIVIQKDILNFFNIRDYAYNNYISSSGTNVILAGDGTVSSAPPTGTTWFIVETQA